MTHFELCYLIIYLLEVSEEEICSYRTLKFINPKSDQQWKAHTLLTGIWPLHQYILNSGRRQTNPRYIGTGHWWNSTFKSKAAWNLKTGLLVPDEWERLFLFAQSFPICSFGIMLFNQWNVAFSKVTYSPHLHHSEFSKTPDSATLGGTTYLQFGGTIQLQVWDCQLWVPSLLRTVLLLNKTLHLAYPPVVSVTSLVLDMGKEPGTCRMQVQKRLQHYSPPPSAVAGQAPHVTENSGRARPVQDSWSGAEQWGWMSCNTSGLKHTVPGAPICCAVGGRKERRAISLLEAQTSVLSKPRQWRVVIPSLGLCGFWALHVSWVPLCYLHTDAALKAERSRLWHAQPSHGLNVDPRASMGSVPASQMQPTGLSGRIPSASSLRLSKGLGRDVTSCGGLQLARWQQKYRATFSMLLLCLGYYPVTISVAELFLQKSLITSSHVEERLVEKSV